MAAVWVTAPALGLKLTSLCGCSVAGQVLERFERDTGASDFYVVCNGRVVDRDEPLQNGSVYHLEPRLRGGKGGFGSMLRALGAQIEKTTNREACRDLSGRRLRDVNHEKEMADWLKKQSEREAEKEQRRLERLQKKLAEPKHHFTDAKYTQQCHELSERLEDSVIKGLQASCSSTVRPDSSKRPSEDRDGPETKRSRGNFSWTGIELDSDEDQDSEESSDSEGAEPVSRGAESEGSGRSSSLSPAPSEDRSTAARPSPGTRSGPDPDQTDSHSKPDPRRRPQENQAESRPNEDPRSTSRPDKDQAESRPNEDPRSTSRPDTDQAESSPDADRSKPESSPDQNQPQDQRPLDLDLDLDSASCAEDLEALGLNVLKEELTRRGLKCGGTLSERAARLFSVRGKREDDIEPALLAKSGKKKQKSH